ncbi:MAG TPA: CAP domain-containing protein [Chloroflexota bacterium]|nr:CAP domain-containing protein [Chloroflexota bacterium]
MRRALVLALLLLVGFVLRGPTPAFADDPAQEVVALVNAQRSQDGLAPLVLSTPLTTAARAYALALAQGNFFSHTGRDGSTFIRRDEAAGYTNWDYLEENLGAGQSTPQQVVAQWLASPDHRANLLSPHVREIGVGHVALPSSQYVNYWVQEFGDRPGPLPVAFQNTAAPLGGAVAGVAPAPAMTPVTAPESASQPLSWLAPTGYRVSGDWLAFMRAHGNVDTLGLPRSNVIPDPLNPAQQIQVFQRAVLELHPENPPGSQIEPRLLGDILYPGADPPVDPSDAPPGPTEYFPLSPDHPTGLGHFVANFTRDGQPLYFKDYFDRHGGVAVFGYPKEEPTLRAGLWTQRFQAAVFQYHPENDRDGFLPGTTIPRRTYRVQLELLGDEYVKAVGIPLDH